MTNKSTGGNGRKKPVKKPTLQEQIDQTLKEADEQIKRSEVIRKKAEELRLAKEVALNHAVNITAADYNIATEIGKKFHQLFSSSFED